MPSALSLLLLALLPAGPPPWLGRCLERARPQALSEGAPLPIDSGAGADHGTCAVQCEGQCVLVGDFDGDGRPRELALASPSEITLYHDLERAKPRRVRAALIARMPLGGEEVALLSGRRAVRFADEVGLLRDGRSLLPPLQRAERVAFGLIVWRGAPEGAPPADAGPDEEEHGRPSESGDLLLGLFDAGTRTYRLQKVLTLGAP